MQERERDPNAAVAVPPAATDSESKGTDEITACENLHLEYINAEWRNCGGGNTIKIWERVECPLGEIEGDSILSSFRSKTAAKNPGTSRLQSPPRFGPFLPCLRRPRALPAGPARRTPSGPRASSAAAHRTSMLSPSSLVREDGKVGQTAAS